MNIENLRLAVEAFKEMRIGEEEFTMAHLGNLNNQRPKTVRKIISCRMRRFWKCKTVACFLGWFPHLPVPELKITDADFLRSRRFSFRLYGKRVLDLEVSDPMWMFLFSGSWRDYNDTLEGALERARVIIRGEFSEDWEYE